MTRDYFKQSYFNPYFQSDHYKNETSSGKTEQKISKILIKIKMILGKKINAS